MGLLLDFISQLDSLDARDVYMLNAPSGAAQEGGCLKNSAMVGCQMR
jgi:hypothetical protein